MSLPGASVTTQPTVTTSFADYAPGETAAITASGFEAGSTIEFQVLHVSGTGADGILGTLDDELEESAGEGHDIWSVTDGGAGDFDGLANGVIQTAWYVNPDDSLNATFLLSAIGSDGQLATNTFTDAAGSINKVYQHWADGDTQAADWNNNILSDGKSNYFEGEVVPHVFAYKASNQTPLVQGQTYSFTITYNNYQLNSNAGGFDYITTYNQSRDPAYFVATTAVTPPTADSTFTNGGGMQGTFYTVDADITTVSAAVLSGSGNEDRKVTVSFVYTGTTTTNGLAEIFFGLAIAQPGDVKSVTSNGASAWTGGSLQTTIDIGGSGATSIQLAPSAIIKGTISGFKFGDVNGNGLWDGGETGLSGWTIYIDKNGDGSYTTGEESTTTASDGSYSFSVIPDSDTSTSAVDPYLIREVNQSGWVQTTLNPAAIVISAADPTEVNVNFGNQQQIAAMNVVKSNAGVNDLDNNGADVDDTIVYSYTVHNGGNVSLLNVTASDDKLGTIVLSGLSDLDNDGDADDLAVGADASGTATATLTQEQIDAGSLTNIVTASGGGLTDTDTNTVNLPANPALDVTKTNAGVVDNDGNGADAGDTIVYSYTVSNSGNVSLLNVTASDDKLGTIVLSGLSDLDNDGDADDLAVGADATGTATATLTQAQIDAGSLTNIVTASGGGLTDTDTNTVTLSANPSISIDKITIIGNQSGDGLTNIAVGSAVTWQYTVTNTGNISLQNVTVVDDAGTSVNLADDFTASYVSGDTGSDQILSPGEVWIFNHGGTTVSGNYTNIGSVTASAPDSISATDSDGSSYSTLSRNYGLIAPTATTVNQYISGTASSFEDYYASQDGVVQYGVKSGLISQTNPGVFFYFTGLSGGLEAVNADGVGGVDKMTIFVDQSDTSATVGAFKPSFSDVRLYKITDLDGNGIDAGDSITSVSLAKNQVSITSGGDVTLNFTPDQIGSLYVVSIKYSTGSVIGSPVGSSPAGWLTVDYSFVTNLNGATLAGENGDISLAPKVKALMLDGEIGSGARAVKDAQLDHVIKQAVQYWSAHGASADEISMLKSADVTISDLGGNWLSMTDGTSITIDDDADGHGWSLGLGGVAPQKVDLFSALVHEMGHLLGYEHEELGDDLAVGERVMPMSADDGHGLPDFVGSMPAVALVGMPDEQLIHVM